MPRFKDIPISKKLLVMSMIVTLLVLSLAAALLTTTIWTNERKAAAYELETIAKLIGANSSAALVFNDTGAANEILATLSTNPDIVSGILYDSGGKEFARYESDNFNTDDGKLLLGQQGTLTHNGVVITRKPVILDNESVGSVLLRLSLKSRLDNLKGTIVPMVFVLVFIFTVLMIIGLWLANSFTAPITELSGIMSRVTREDDYSLRTNLDQRDEVGVLAAGINEMLSRVQARDIELMDHRHELEKQVAQRTSDLQEANNNLKEELTERGKAEQELKQAHESLELQHKNFSLLSRMNDRLQVCHAIDEIKSVAMHYLRQLFTENSGALYIYNHSRSLLESVAVWGEPYSSVEVFSQDDCWALRQGRLHIVEDASTGLVCPHCSDIDTGAYVCAPMIAYGEVVGVLHLSQIQAELFSSLPQQLIITAAEHLAHAIANLRLREELQMQSVHDHLTGLFNRRYLQETLERELARALRTGQQTAVIMMDIDHFKTFNDTQGHEAGDMVLREFGAFFKENVRAEDIACRYGGEEFIAIMPGAGVEVVPQNWTGG